MLFTDKLLFRPEAIRPKLPALRLPPDDVRDAVLHNWVRTLNSKAGREKKETELLPLFLADIFGKLLGYTEVPAEPYTLRREALVKVDGKYADAALGHFSKSDSKFVVMVEGKGPKDPLDRPFAGRKLSALEQGLRYAVQQETNWYVVTNLKEIRLYHKGHDTYTSERFDLKRMAENDTELRRFVYVLGAERVLAPGGNHLEALLVESAKIGRDLTNEYYREYRQLRENTFAALRRHNPGQEPVRLLTATQKLLDRVLFIAFAEDRGLMPRESIKHAWQNVDRYNPRPVWDNFKSLFRAVDTGSDRLNVAKYNGGLFQPDDDLESLNVPDDVCAGFNDLAKWEYSGGGDGKLIDVEILGHIFEQSISDLEEMQRALQDSPLFASDAAAVSAKPAGPSKRKKEGAFYTPPFVTRYIVEQTLGAVLQARYETLRTEHAAAAGKSKVLDEPVAFDAESLKPADKKLLLAFWTAWHDVLQSIRICDPACGSGAFLMEAFDRMAAEYRKAEGYLVSLGEHGGLFKTNKTVLTRNLFGMDLNSEAVEIARLSCWIKTAELGEILTSLDDNVKEGNSIVAEPDPLTAWAERFPEVMAEGGFDVVIGNPPYVRQEWITKHKPFLQKHYQAYDGVADLYVYFYELGLKLLRPGGRLGLIVTNKWLKAGYGAKLRQLYSDTAWVDQVVDFGHAKQIFPDADVFPCIVVARRPTPDLTVPAEAKVCVIPREQLRVDDLSKQIAEEGVSVPRARFGAEPWNLEPPGVTKLMGKIKSVGVILQEYAGTTPIYGVKTGCNEAFVVDSKTREALISEHPSSNELLRKYLRGQDIDRWCGDWAGEWMIFSRRGLDINSYPAIKRHLMKYKNELEPKPVDHDGKNWPGRKSGAYKWYEIQDPVEYWKDFDKPKIGYQVIQYHPSYMYDDSGMLGNDKTFFITNADMYLLGVLNSPLMWWHNWRAFVHLKDEALSPMGYLVAATPIAEPTKSQRKRVESSALLLIGKTKRHRSECRDLLNWLRVEFGVEKPTQRLQAAADLTADALAAEVRKIRGKHKPLSVAEVKRLGQAHTEQVLPLQTLAREALHLERIISDEVNAAYGLTLEDVALMWATAPPRMPLPPPK